MESREDQCVFLISCSPFLVHRAPSLAPPFLTSGFKFLAEAAANNGFIAVMVAEALRNS